MRTDPEEFVVTHPRGGGTFGSPSKDAAAPLPLVPLPLALLLSCLLLGIGFLLWARRRRRQERLRLLRSGILDIDRMTGAEFEECLAGLFEAQGYAVRRIGRAGDFGGDLLLRKGGEEIVVQAKRYRGLVGVRAVQEATAARGYYRCGRAWVATNSRFTRAAVRLARANGVELLGRGWLIGSLLRACVPHGPP